MTRFARSKGSKSSNERVPEKATSWAEMRAQLDEKKTQTEFEKNQKQAEAKRRENYNNFLEEFENDKIKNAEWASFPEEANAQSTKGKKNNKQKKQVSNQNKADKPNMKRKLEENNDNNNITEGSIASKKLKKKPNKNNDSTEEHENKKDDTNNNEEARIGKKNKKKGRNNNNTETTENENTSINETNTVQAANKKNLKKKAKGANIDAETTIENKAEELNNSSNKKSKKAQTMKKVNADSELQQGNDSENIVERNNKQQNNNNVNKNFANKQQGMNKNNNQQMKQNKKKQMKEKTRRKPDSYQETMFINGVSVAIGYFDGFPIKKEDCERLKELKKQMISRGLPKSEVQRALKLERRRAEKALAREKKKVCFNCRKSGHVLSECPNLSQSGPDTINSGICFKCGSTEHTHFECRVNKKQEYKFATCFICKEQGHISNQCPDNPRGVYPKGGACKLCGAVTHLKKDCPQYQAEKEEQNICLDKIENGNIESLDNDGPKIAVAKEKKNKIVKF